MKSPIPALLLALATVPVHARDLPSGDLVRKDIIAAVRQHPAFTDALKDVKLDVRRIWASAQHAYLCALPIDRHGHYQMTDGWYDVYQIVLKRDQAKWVLAARVDGLSQVLRQVQCLADAQGEINDAFLAKMTADGQLKP